MNRVLGAAGIAAAVMAACALAQPQYEIYDIGVIDPGDFSQGFGVSPGGVAVGRTLGVSNQGFSWTPGGGLVGLPNLDGRPFGAAHGANDSGLIVGDGTTTIFGAGSLPLIWENGAVSQLPLLPGEDVGRARAINSAGVAVGSNGSGDAEYGVYYDSGGVFKIARTTDTGCSLRVAYGISDGGRVVGFGIDPHNAARNVGFVYDIATDTAFELGGLDGRNGAIAFGIGNGGHIVGTSMLNQGDGLPFIWTEGAGMMPIPLPPDTSLGSARAVNASGWAVGTAGGVYAVPFLFDGAQTYALQDLIADGTGWDLSTNTSSAAEGISDSAMIIGTGELNGEVHAFAMVLVPGPGVLAILGVAGLLAATRRR